MDIVYQLGRATSLEVHARLPDAPTHTTVRGLLRVLEGKGHLRHEEDGPRYVYLPSTPREDAGTSLLSHVIGTFFGGSPSRAMAALIGRDEPLAEAELERIARLVEDARRSPPKE
jgi:BlaI family transcriptional regulator, penicillinase repressor